LKCAKLRFCGKFPYPINKKKFLKASAFTPQTSFFDAQLLHPRPQRGSIDVQHFGRASCAADAPARLLQYFDDTAALQLFERNGNSANFESNKRSLPIGSSFS
jgi:hypothetical protein